MLARACRGGGGGCGDGGNCGCSSVMVIWKMMIVIMVIGWGDASGDWVR